MNNNYTLTLLQLVPFGFNFNGAKEQPIRFNPHNFWSAITGRAPYAAVNAKATAIHNPYFRYMQHFMAHAIFGRGDSDGVVRQSELFLMWAMIESYSVDVGYYLMKQFMKVAQAQRGDIVIGGLIARHFRLNLSDLDIVLGSSRIDPESLSSMHMIKHTGDRYCLIFRNLPLRIKLPQSRHTFIQARSNWLYDLTANVLTDDQLDPVCADLLESSDEEDEEESQREGGAPDPTQQARPSKRPAQSTLDSIQTTLTQVQKK